MKIRLTQELLASARTDKGGLTRAQAHVLGLDWPPPKGWAKALRDTEMDQEQFQRFMDARLITVKAAPPGQGSLF